MQYIIDDKHITIHKDGKTHLISKDSNSYFDFIKSTLLKAGTANTNLLSWGGQIKQATAGAFNYNKGKFYYEDEPVPKSVGERIKELEDQNLPFQPLINFWLKLKDHPDREIREKLGQSAGRPGIPLTWDGDLILYTRASWVPPSADKEEITSLTNLNRFTRLDWSSNKFTPGKTMVSSTALICGDFTWITEVCPDAGVIYDIQVNPLHVVKSSPLGGKLEVSQFTYLSQLEEHSALTDKIFFVKVETNTFGKQLVVRKPYSPESLREYLANLMPGTNKMKETESQTVSVRGGC
jgi:hypothetical protein